ncbi:MAG: aconitase X [Candidatus Acetothermia bacterium]
MTFYSLLGYYVGSASGGQVPVITGLPTGINRDALKSFGTAVASSGGVGLFHIVGVTPEAPDLESIASEEGRSRRTDVSGRDLLDVKGELNGTTAHGVDLVLLGCPHASVRECQSVADEISGRTVADGVEFWIQTNRGVYSWLEGMGISRRLRKAGVRVSTDSCLFNWPLDNWNFSSAVTNSAKFAHYAPNELNLTTSIRDINGCVSAAVTGGVYDEL